MKESPETLPLAGEWTFALDPDNAGIKQRWFATSLKNTIMLPGTTDEAGYVSGQNICVNGANTVA